MRKNPIIMGLALALTLGASGLAAAQGTARPERSYGAQQDSGFRRGPGGRGGPEGMLLRGITLSADQQTRLQQLADSRRKQFEAEHPQGGGSQGADAQGRQQRREQHVAAIREILNADQRVQFDKNLAEMKARGAERRGGPDRPNRDQQGQ
jgi:hypothetical protein